ncbi:FAD synthase-like isoform X2 [Sitophilus oryzae]|uniref:FAD synthase-like isoform X2 n=1 Tax=Sitophilus oryzae TaxID=7048 RepID=A0A6J2XA17_SITOR|nr:FAD synthase-like isoform X2 [Sitophilus oryzae]
MSLRCLCKNISGAHIKINNFWTNKYSTIKTAGVLVIGDEILKGEVPDTNSTLIAQELHNFGLKLKKITVVADDINDISEEVRYFSKKYDYVLTTGGIGPTHDDVTYEAVALAFDVPLVLHSDLEKICSKFFKTVDPMSPGMKQAYFTMCSCFQEYQNSLRK